MAGKERKHSAKRDAILKVLRGTTVHPGAQWVYSQLKGAIPDLSLGTVYRNLKLFREEGLAAFLGTVNGEERFDGVTESHPHLICRRCGAIEDITLANPEAFEKELAGVLAASVVKNENRNVKEGGFDFRRTLFYGLCRDCGT
ncbi:MAG: transcriptional repressor [Treponema sp.]|jgi:Fur family peroxide stress response transcriptional regulator|nr:transcriptional repressor [Treponema sp.]